jgi:hypothetical protein
MHKDIKTYLDGEFYLAPLASPQTILDIGYAQSSITCITLGVTLDGITNVLLRYNRAGSGIWYIRIFSGIKS